MLLTVFAVTFALLAAGAAVAVMHFRRRRTSRVIASQREATTKSRKQVAPVAEASVLVSESSPMPEALSELSVLSSEDIGEAAKAVLDEICTDVGEPHPVHRKLATGLDEPEDLVEVVSSDAGLSADVLRTVNSASFALMEPITSVPQAVNYLGVSIVKAVVLRATLRSSEEHHDPKQEASMVHVWQSACAASAMARLLALELGLSRPSVLGTKTLFCNIGDVAMLRAVAGAEAWYHDGATILDRIQDQQRECGLNAALVGAAIVRQWELPDVISGAIEASYLPLIKSPSEYSLQGDARMENILIYLAMVIGDRVTYNGLRDVATLELHSGSEPELFWLSAHLHGAHLGQLAERLKSPSFSRKANRVLSTFSDRR